MSAGKATADDLESFAGETTKLLNVVAELMRRQQALIEGEPEASGGGDQFLDMLPRLAEANATLSAAVAKVLRDQADIIDLADTLIKEQALAIARLRGEVSALGGRAPAEPSIVRLH